MIQNHDKTQFAVQHNRFFIEAAVCCAALFLGTAGVEAAEAAEAAAVSAETSVTSTGDAAGQEFVSSDFITGEVGEVITFGMIDQDGDPANGAEPIEWKILEKNPGELLLLCRDGLAAHQYEKLTENGSAGTNSGSPGSVVSDSSVSEGMAESAITWEDSDLRNWLNSEFAAEAFNDLEWDRIIELTCSNGIRTRDGLYAAYEDTTDKITLLSFSELENYLPNDVERIMNCSKTALGTGAESYWWLRTASDTREAYVIRGTDGLAGTVDAAIDKVCIRPVILISMYHNDSGRSIDCSSPEIIMKVQTKLNELGYNCGTPDGAAGPATAAAVIQYQMDNCIKVSGVITEEMVACMGL